MTPIDAEWSKELKSVKGVRHRGGNSIHSGEKQNMGD
jgi:hypothetical protein